MIKETWRQIWIYPMENVWFPFISIVWLHFSHKTEIFWFWKSLKYYNIFWQRNIWRQTWKMSDFVSFPLLGFTLVIKIRNFDFESHWNTLIFFDKKKRCQIWLCPVKPCLIWFKLCYTLRNMDFKFYWNGLIFFN